jgi:parallel beta-helix repeat protein
MIACVATGVGKESSLSIGPDEPLQAAIDAAPPGASLSLTEGEYAANISVLGHLVIRAESGARVVLRGVSSEEPSVAVGAGGALTITGITVQGSGGGVRVDDGGLLRAVDCTIEETEVPVELMGAAQALLETSTIRNNEKGVVVRGTSYLEVNQCVISLNGDDGVWLFDSARAEIQGTQIADHKFEYCTTFRCELYRIFGWGSSVYFAGIHLQDSAFVSVRNCDISGNDCGIATEGTSRVVITDSRFSDSGAMGALQFRASSSAEVTASQVSDSNTAILLNDSASAKVTGCRIANCSSDGIRVYGQAWLTLEDNSIIGSAGAGVYGDSIQLVTGHGNRFIGNGVDAVWNVEGSVRAPMREPAAREVTYPGAGYTSLQEAADALLPGGTLYLGPGDYRESITISGDVVLRGNGTAATRMRAATLDLPVISLLSGARLGLEDVTLADGRQGVLAGPESRSVVSRTIVTGCSEGILAFGSAIVSVCDSELTDNTGAGTHFQNTAQGVLERCKIRGNETGVAIKGSAAAQISYSVLSANTVAGVAFSGSSQGTLTGCLFTQNGEGVSIGSSAPTVLLNNTLTENRSCGVRGLGDTDVGGAGNLFLSNGVDLVGSVPGNIRLPLKEPTEQKIVFPSDAYQGVQEAIDALVPGGTLVFRSGEYAGGLTISKRLQIVCSEEEVAVLGTTSATGILISVIPGGELEATRIVLRGGTSGINVAADARVVLSDCTISSPSSTGLVIEPGAQTALHHCEVSDAGSAGISVSGGELRVDEGVIRGNEGDGVSLSGSARGILEKTELTDNAGYGLRLSGESSAACVDLRVSHSGSAGVAASYLATITMLRCTVTENAGSGLSLDTSTQVEVTDSSISANRSDGIQLRDSSSVKLHGCTLAENWLNAVYAEDTAHAEVSRTEVRNNIHGLEVADSALLDLVDSVLSENRFCGVTASGSARATLQKSEISGNGVGVRVEGTAQAVANSCAITENDIGIVLLDSAQVVCDTTRIAKSAGSGIALWGDASAALSSCYLLGNARADIEGAVEPVSVGGDGFLASITVVGDGAGVAIPESPPAPVLGAVDSVVEVWADGTDPKTGEFWPFAANGFAAGTRTIVTAGHLFLGEDEFDPNNLLLLEALTIRDPDAEESLAEIDDLVSDCGPNPVLDLTHDLAAIYLSLEIPGGLAIAPSAIPYDVAWIVAYIGYLGGDEFCEVPVVVSIPDRDTLVLWRDEYAKGALKSFLPDVVMRSLDSQETEEGMSGAPVVDRAGRVIGIAIGRRSDSQTGVFILAASPQFAPSLDPACAKSLP